MSRYEFELCRTETISQSSNYPWFPGDMSSNDKWVAGRIFWEFKIQPTLTPADYSNLNLYFDVTRQREVNTCKMISGTGVFDSCRTEKFPWLKSPPLDNEQPNDDSGPVTQNDNSPNSSALIYSFDPPGLNRYDILDEDIAFQVFRAAFKEFVRIQVTSPFMTGPKPNDNLLEGSRCSMKMDWHTTFHQKRGSDPLYRLELDQQNVTVSFPVKEVVSSSAGSIQLSVNDPNGVSTNGYQLEYILSNRTWILERIVNGGANISITINESAVTGEWHADFDGIDIEIIESGNSPFVAGDRYTYSTYSTNNSSKINRIDTVPFNVFSQF